MAERVRFVQVDGQDDAMVATLSRVAYAIVKDYYDPLLGTAQNAYMLDKFQSPAALYGQLARGYRYYLVADSTGYVGFVGFYPAGTHLYLSKFYLQAASRGLGYGRQMLDFVAAAAQAEGLAAIQLNVNKYNPTIQVYEHMGFRRVGSEKNDIGNGYYMDDYVYRLTLV